MSEFGVDVERDGDGVAWVVLRNPGKLNAVRLEMWQAIPGAIAALVADPQVRVVVLRGHGGEAFASGADISEFATHRKDAASAAAYEAVTADAFAALIACEKPVVAMMQGVCIGGGLAIAVSADLRIAADDTKMALPPARLGLGYHLAGVERVVEIVGPSVAAEMFFTARQYTADEALAVGLVNRVVPKADLLSFTRRYVSDIAQNAPLTIRAAKRAIGEVQRDPSQRDAATVARMIAACFQSRDYAEGVRAFQEKRRPKFEGR
ncbi:MAG TPA: enoyl-CoA hydratase [Candidatus Eisenbacteria bacterium]|nr:enoyl-CoA hydratase [Candidatus Eisenbacteria bacterium]